jgi:hypothetical protein
MLKTLLINLRKEIGDGYPSAININYNRMWGLLAGIFLLLQLGIGTLLLLKAPGLEGACRYVRFNLVFFFLCLYWHIAKVLYFKLYLNSTKVWLMVLIIFILHMSIVFISYLLPWGATALTNLFSAIPIMGEDLVSRLWSGFSVDNPTLNKLYFYIQNNRVIIVIFFTIMLPLFNFLINKYFNKLIVLLINLFFFIYKNFVCLYFFFQNTYSIV